ncbi:MAG TPA: hypothetical protein VMU05_06245 [Dongiaceae bacterium]|nr:hypothetical protein [Dongiaceae bacterium]
MRGFNFVFGIWAFMAAITVPIAVWAIRLKKRRTQEFAAVAQQLGFRFLSDEWRGPVLSPEHKTCIIQRTRGGFRNVMLGSVGGLDVALFDYIYQAGKSTITLTLAAFTQERELPAFELRSENIFDRIGEAFLHRDIDFDSNPEFSRRYFLRSPDEAGVRRLFTNGLLAYFEQIPPEKKWQIETSAKTVIIYSYRQFMKASEIPAFQEEASAIARTILASAH